VGDVVGVCVVRDRDIKATVIIAKHVWAVIIADNIGGMMSLRQESAGHGQRDVDGNTGSQFPAQRGTIPNLKEKSNTPTPHTGSAAVKCRGRLKSVCRICLSNCLRLTREPSWPHRGHCFPHLLRWSFDFFHQKSAFTVLLFSPWLSQLWMENRRCRVLFFERDRCFYTAILITPQSGHF